ncbi:ethanolamine utilization protein EutN [Lachnospiraceae bacterium KGMB03038]|nr:ethanolamine utilization protein EutN [Lachnospiraceae bacterium KGMB03038]
MYIGKVIGTVVSTCKEQNLKGLKLLIVRNLFEKDPDKSEIAVDAAGAGVGDCVLVTIDGGAARMAAGVKDAPINNAVIGIVDHPEMYLEGKQACRKHTK